MKRVFSIFAVIVLILSSCMKQDSGVTEKEEEQIPETPPEPHLPERKALRILAIGNSFSSDAVEQNLWDLFHAAGYTVAIGNLYAPGSYLGHHWSRIESDAPEYKYVKVMEGKASLRENVRFSECIYDEDWDIISLQQASDISGKYEKYQPYLKNILDVLGNCTGASCVFHQTWAYPSTSTQAAFADYDNDQETMYNAIMSAVQQAFRDEPRLLRVIPSGTAIQNARLVMGDVLNRDGLHLELTYGRYTAAWTWFETITGVPVTGIDWWPDTITEDLARQCQACAHAACEKPYEVTLSLQ